jgi:hypothetical protein
MFLAVRDQVMVMPTASKSTDSLRKSTVSLGTSTALQNRCKSIPATKITEDPFFRDFFVLRALPQMQIGREYASI